MQSVTSSLAASAWILHAEAESIIIDAIALSV